MKKRLFILFALTFAFAGCASKPAEQSQTEQAAPQEVVEEVSPYSDWKYMGFGQEIPQWVEIVLSDSEIEIQKAKIYQILPEFSGKDMQIIKDISENLDQAENRLKQNIDSSTEFTLYNTFWVQMTETGDYVALALLFK